MGVHHMEGRITEVDADVASGFFTRACELRFQPACLNLLDPESALRGAPKALDLRLLLREGGRNLMQMTERDLFARACDHGWRFACEARPVSS
jgi:hypothetical protein